MKKVPCSCQTDRRIASANSVTILKSLFLLLFVISFSYEASAATIYGTIYDIGFEEFKNVIIEINTTPKQYFVSKVGNYSFDVPEGSYTLEATYILGNETLASHQESIMVTGEGEYILDMILFIDIDVGKDIGEDNESIDFTIDPNNNNDNNKQSFFGRFFLLGIVVFILVVGLGYGMFRFLKSHHQDKDDTSDNLPSLQEKEETEQEQKEEEREIGEKETKAEVSDIIETVDLPDDAKQVLKIIKERGGRTTQKDIRKDIPLSEAKISLILTDLEQRKFIRKIKKGRGNIIILHS